MSTPPTKNPGPAVVTFTARGNEALDHLAARLAADCDGSPASIADLLGHVLEADIEDLAESMDEADPLPARHSHLSHAADEIPPTTESPDDKARRRLAARATITGSTTDAPIDGIPR